MKIVYGDGTVWTQQGATADGHKCLTVNIRNKPMPINSQPDTWPKTQEEDKIDCLIVFKNIESARTLQDELNELVSKWSRELGGIVKMET